MVLTRRIAASALLVLFTAVATAAQAPADNAEAFAAAVRKGDAPAVKELLDEGVDVNTKYRYDATRSPFASRPRTCRGRQAAPRSRRRPQRGRIRFITRRR